MYWTASGDLQQPRSLGCVEIPFQPDQRFQKYVSLHCSERLSWPAPSVPQT